MMDAQNQSLKNELDAALADLEEAATLGEINQTLVDMLEVLRVRKVSPAPQVNVQVAAPSVIVSQPAEQIDYFTFEYNTKGQIIKSVPHRSPRKGT